MRGLSVAIAAWQIRQVLTLGSPARGPLVTLSWQYSVQVSPFSMWMLWGNSIGCDGRRFDPEEIVHRGAERRSCAV